MKFGIVVFPGSNCDHDAYHAANRYKDVSVKYIWHKDTELPAGLEFIILPGGFSYGDYLRSGAIAKFSPIMKEVVTFANRGGYVLGICNGFQILTEVGLLPGALLRNKSLHFACKDVHLKVENYETKFTRLLPKDRPVKWPIAHGEGNYFADADTIKELEDENRIIFRYADKSGNVCEEANPNGSIDNIAGISNKYHNVLGLMPHPERYSEALLGGDDGIAIFDGIKKRR